MMRKPILCLFFILSQWMLFGQNNLQDPIEWNEGKLTWNDFKADRSVKNKTRAASTASGITYSWTYAATNDFPELNYEVKTHFYPQRSWVSPEDKTPALLAHEQLHFDISELHARKLLKELEAYTAMRNIRTDLKRIYSKIESARNKMQRLYDKETNHGLNKIAQENWGQKITKDLMQLEKYGNR